MKNPPVIDRLVNTLFPEEPVLNPNDDADMSLEYLRERAKQAKADAEAEDDLLECFVDSYRDDLLIKAKKWRDSQNAYMRHFHQDRHSKHQPLTEVEALWRIERAILRVAHALEASNDRD